MARISRWRGWPKANVVIGPAALVVVVVAMGVLQLGLLAEQTRERQGRYEAIARELAEAATEASSAVPRVVITDHPMWLATLTDGPAIALPDEDPEALLALGRSFGTDWLVVVDERGRYPDALLERPGSGCLSAPPRTLGDGDERAWLFRLAEGCQ
jgi:hypothetical protein